MRDYSDSEIIDALKRDNNNAVIEYIYSRYCPMIRHLVLKRSGNFEDVEDLFQDGLTALISAIRKGKLSLTCSLKTYLYVICVNLWKTRLRKDMAAQNYMHRYLEEEEPLEISEEMDLKMKWELFYEMYAMLGESCKEILRLWFFKYSLEQISEKLGLSYGYVKKRKSLCQNKLMDLIKSHPKHAELASSKVLGEIRNKNGKN